MRVVSIGQCGFDSSSIERTFGALFDADVVHADGFDDAVAHCNAELPRLILVNRLLDRDGSSGLEVISSLRQQVGLKEIPVMLVSNFPDWQEKAVRLGAAPGFGKSQLREEETLRRCIEGAVGELNS